MYKFLLLLVACLVLLPACKKPRRPPGPQEPLDLKPEQVSFDLQGLGSRLRGEVVPLVVGDPDAPPFMDGEPEHLRFAFDDDRLTGQGDQRERQILVYPVASYAGLFLGVERMEFEKRVDLLATLVKNRPPRVAEPIHFFPSTDTPQLFHGQIRYLEFTDGAGVRCIAHSTSGPGKHAGDSLLYAFQGLTRNGKYLVCFYYPVTVQGFSSDGQPTEAARFLDGRRESDFTPDLAKLDGLVRSIRIRPASP